MVLLPYVLALNHLEIRCMRFHYPSISLLCGNICSVRRDQTRVVLCRIHTADESSTLEGHQGDLGAFLPTAFSRIDEEGTRSRHSQSRLVQFVSPEILCLHPLRRLMATIVTA